MVSVCLASYNGERFIKKQIESILIQLSKDDELIISDDGSTDSTLDIINSFCDDRIKLCKHIKKAQNDSMYKSFIYATKNFENALQKAKGDYIFLSDQDDIWMDSKLLSCLKLLEQYDCVVHNYQKIDEQDNIILNKAFMKNPLHNSLFMNAMDNHFRGCCMAFRAEYLKVILPIPDRIIGHDYWIGSLLYELGNVYYDTEPRLQSRWYPESVSAKKKTSIWYKIKYRKDLYQELKKRLKEQKND